LNPLVQVRGAIGDDSTDTSWPANPADVDFYHFHIAGPRLTAFAAEVFAARIGSPLDAALSLFRLEADGSLRFVASNGGTGNPARATDRSQPPLPHPPGPPALPAGGFHLARRSRVNHLPPRPQPLPRPPH